MFKSKNAGSILTDALSQDVNYVLQVFKENDINSNLVLKRCSRLFWKKIYVERIEKIIDVLKDNQIPTKIIESCTSLLVINSDVEMKRIFETLKNEPLLDYKQLITACPSILAFGKANEIKKIKNELGEDYQQIIKSCPYVLARNTADEIKKIKVELGKDFQQIISTCPTILAQGTAKNIAEIKKQLGDDEFAKLIETKPTLLFASDAQTIEKYQKQYGENYFEQLTTRVAEQEKKQKTQEKENELI